MRVLAVEDEAILLRQLTNQIRHVLPESEILSFDNADDAPLAFELGASDFLLKPVLHYLPRFAWQEASRCCEVCISGLGLKIGELAGPSVALNGLYEAGQWRP